MQPSYTQLPCELQYTIFSQTSKGDWMQLQFTCKAWRKVARELFYRTVNLNIDDTERLKSLQCALSCPNNQNRLLIKKLVINGWSYTFDPSYNPSINDYTCLLIFAPLCPNLTWIEINHKPNRFYQDLVFLRSNGHLQRLEYIEMPYHFDTKEYYEAIFAFRSSLTEILLKSDFDYKSSGDNSIINAFPVASCLSDFTCLKKLHMVLPGDTDLCKIDELLDMCTSQLQVVDIDIREKDRDFEVIKIFDLQQKSTLPHVKEFILNGACYLTNQDMIYIIFKFPALNYLCISPSYSPYDPWNDLPEKRIQSAGVLCKFLEYISKIQKFELKEFVIVHDILIKGITQLSKCFQVDNLRLVCSHKEDVNSAELSLEAEKPVPNEQPTPCEVSIRMPSLGIHPLYQHALETFCQETKILVLSGRDFKDNDDDVHKKTLELTDMQITQSGVFVEGMDFILNHFISIDELTMDHLIINPLPSYTASTEKLQLYTFKIECCTIHSQALQQFSQSLEYIKDFYLDCNDWVEDDSISMGFREEYTINMPFTEFGTIRFDNEWGPLYLLKICSIDNTPLMFQIDKSETLQSMTEEEFNKSSSSTDDLCVITVYCMQYEKIILRNVIITA